MYIEKKLPSVLRPIVEKWGKSGTSFYLGPENIFFYKGKRIRYRSNPGISSRKGSWYAKSKDWTSDQVPLLKSSQVEDVAMCLAQYHKPSSWAILVDYRCNYACPMCPFWGEGYNGDYWVGRENLRRVMPKEEVFSYIDILVENNIETVTLSSPGEIFLYPDWEEISGYAAKKGLRVGVITNGSMIGPKFVKRMEAAGITNVSVSLDALSQETYAKVRSDKDRDYNRAMESPILLKENGFTVQVAFVRQKENLHEVSAFKEYWRQKPIDSISIGFQTEYSDGLSKDKLELNKQDDFIHGICSWYGNFVVLNNGIVTACCEMQTLYKDDHSFELPVVKFGQADYARTVSEMNKLLSEKNSPLLPICKKCAMYTLPFVLEEEIGDWIVTRIGGKETWTRNSTVKGIYKILMKHAPSVVPLARVIYLKAQKVANQSVYLTNKIRRLT